MNPSLGNRYSQHSFAKVPTANTPRSVFNRSFAAKDTCNFDELTPIFLDEVLPGDTINLNLKTFIRLATQAVPVLDNMYVDFYWFYEPSRILWDNFVKQMGERVNPGDSIDYLTPQINPTGLTFAVGSLGDHFGLPTDILMTSAGAPINALPFRMYNDVWNKWFRDQNLQNSLTVLRTDGPDPIANYPIQKVAKKHDYFTSALPFLQKGDPVSIPISGSAPVIGNGQPFHLSPTSSLTASQIVNMKSDGTAPSTSNYLSYAGTGQNSYAYAPEGITGGLADSGLQAAFGVSDSVLILINSFRQAMQLQSFLEQDARGGTRFTEVIKAHFNVETGDSRLQRPEFLSGGTIPIAQHPVPQTSESATTPQANLAAFSTAAEFSNKIGFNKSFVEHGYVMGFMRARADVTYQQGLNKMWSRRTRYDYFWPKFQELGEQAILNQEIYLGTAAVFNQNTFGYQERYAEYRYYPSQIRGQFRSTYAQSLDVWHLAEEFGSLPQLNSTFIQSNTPIERILTVTEGYPALLCDFWFDYKHVRPMVAYPVPASLGRF